ncbi:MAG TPA: DUF3040 domain-containing protein [Streptosporangiaceae bacterium]|nr:DUF3040 domain-containing protein [Streptosporangiaceae bacterium]
MSLVPSERRALARIENVLRSSDPGLATMLATFTHPKHRNGLFTWRRIKPFVPVALAITGICLIVAGGILLGRGGRPVCDSSNLRGTMTWQLSDCSAQSPAHRIGPAIGK